MGNVTVGANGAVCEYWNNTSLPDYQLSIIANINQILYGERTAYSNQCRNVNDDENGPWCYSKQQEYIKCNIPYCGLLKILLRMCS